MAYMGKTTIAPEAIAETTKTGSSCDGSKGKIDGMLTSAPGHTGGLDNTQSTEQLRADDISTNPF
jgi:hypothetical protein